MSTFEILISVLTALGFIPLYIDLAIRLKERNKITFELSRFYEKSSKPVQSNWGIRITHPDRPIERCTVLYNGTKLPWWDRGDEPYYERYFVVGGGGKVRVPVEIEDEGAEVIVMDGRHQLKKMRFRDMLRIKPTIPL